MTLSRSNPHASSAEMADRSRAGEDATLDGVVTIRRSRLEYGDGGAMWRLARESGVLEENAEYTYHMFSHFFGETSTVADLDGRAVGFVAGFSPPYRPESIFVWQIAVDPVARGRGLGVAMLHAIISRLGDRIRYLEATVTPDNEASMRTFRKVARDLNTGVTEEVLFPGNRFHGPSHEDEVLFRIGPIDPAEVAKYAQTQAVENGNRDLVVQE